jgi:TonB family protein
MGKANLTHWKTLVFIFVVLIVAITGYLLLHKAQQVPEPPIPMPPFIEELAPPPPPPVKATGNVNPPKLIKQVDPHYPEVARQGRVEGVVILECITDVDGNVADVKVLRSIPLLDQAAVDAVKQWKYEPMMIDGKAHPVIFTVTVRFKLN